MFAAKWKPPFRRWAQLLRPNDTVVTFNYDRVIELLRNAQRQDAQERGVPSGILHVVLPARSLDQGAFQGCCRVHRETARQRGLAEGARQRPGPSGEVKFLDVPASSFYTGTLLRHRHAGSFEDERRLRLPVPLGPGLGGSALCGRRRVPRVQVS